MEPSERLDWEGLVRALGRFGLPPREAVLYLALLRRGRASASELARESRLERVLGYRILEAMRSRGLVEVTAERPRRYAPTPPTALFSRVLRDRRDSLREDERLAARLRTELPEPSASVPGGGIRYQVLVGESPIYAYLREMVGRARTEIVVMMTHRSVRESLNSGIQGAIVAHLRGGGRFRLILETGPGIRTLQTRLRRTLRRFRRAAFREVAVQPTRMTVIDETEALVFLVTEARSGEAEQVAIWSDSPSFVAGQLRYFDTVWASAQAVVPSGPRRRPAG